VKALAAVLDTIGRPRPYAQSEPLRLEELELDPPQPGELLIRIEAAGICHSDLSVIDGSRPRPLPIALGHEAAGVVEAVGAGVHDVLVDDHVVLTFVPSCGNCGHCTGGRPALCAAAAAANNEGRLLAGGQRLHRSPGRIYHHLGVSAFATHAVVARGSAVVIPSTVPFETAALFGCAVLTGAEAVLETAQVRPGESAAIFGLGGVGLSAIMGAIAAGAHPVIGVDPVASKRELALKLGAVAAFEPAEAETQIAKLTRGGVQHAFDTAGHPSVFEAAYRATARGGTTIAVGLPDPTLEIRLPAATLVSDSRQVLGSYMGNAVPQRDIPRLLTLWTAGRLPVEHLHTATISLSEINSGLDDLADGTAIRQIVSPQKP
jgi:alcohol dehydrogenase